MHLEADCFASIYGFLNQIILTIALTLFLCYFSPRMGKEYTVKEAALAVGVSDSRIRQLALAGEIEHSYFGKMIVITERGVQQARARNKKLGRPFKSHKKELSA
jgi:hypothetical protein